MIRSSALMNLGFRPFFLGAGIYAVVSIAVWTGVYSFNLTLPATRITAFTWHAHEMVYGYSLAVIAGFLLTAVGNWTGIAMPRGGRLLALFGLWLAARLIYLTGATSLLLAGIFDILFVSALTYTVGAACVRARQWKQMAIVGKLVLLVFANGLFYLGIAGVHEDGTHWGIYGGLYLVIGLILTMARRIVPFFIEMAITPRVNVKNSKWLDSGSLLLFLGFFISEVFTRTQSISALLAVGLFVVNTVRLLGWHTPRIWKVPLLWSLYSALIFITLGFALFALGVFGGLSLFPAIHAFAFGGIGMITLSMMSRVSLAHTGRTISDLPRKLSAAFLLLGLGALIRVLLPLVDTSYYLAWILLSQALWMAAFALFVLTCAPMLVSPRVDGKPG